MYIKLEDAFKRSEVLFTVLALVHYSTDWLPLILSGGASEGDGFSYSSINLAPNVLLYLLTYIAALCLLLLRWKKSLYVFSKDRVICVMLGLTFASIMWSVNPSGTLKSFIGLFGTTLFGLYFGSRFSIKDQVKLLSWCYLIIITLSLLFIIALPRYGIMAGVHTGAWRGIFTHKNLFGQAIALSGILFLMLADIFKQKKWIPQIALGIAIMILPLARSTTSMINTLILFIALFIYRTFRFRYLFLIPLFFTALTCCSTLYFLYINYIDVIFGAIGKDPSLTGRTDIWGWAWEMIEKRFWLGYGFTAFWNELDGPSAYIIRAARWPVPYAHNGILDLWLDLGLLGVLTYVIGFFVTVCRSIWYARVSVGLSGLWPLIYLTYIVISNITEGGLIAQNSMFWVLYTALAISVTLPPERQLKLQIIPQT